MPGGPCPEWGRLEGGKTAELSHGATFYSRHPGGGGPGAPVAVCVHGFSFWSFVFKPLVARLRESRRFSWVVSFDRYGRGLSDVARDAAGDRVGVTVEAAAEQVRELLEHLGLREEPLVLVGASLGGLVATAFAAQHPRRVAKLVLLAPSGLKNPPGLNSLAIRLLFLPVVGRAIFLALGTGIQLRRIAEDRFAEDLGHDIGDTDPELLANVTAVVKWQILEKEGYIEDMWRTLVSTRWDDAEHASAVAAHDFPVEVVWGEADAVLPVEQAALWKQAIPRARVTVLEGGNHSDVMVESRLDPIVEVIFGEEGR